ncbi:MAG TPA: PilZ domain-containing protein [Magnetococcales bacterium]|nr:PilZ domain-containing protein [Magnetococcales bacterium]
MEETRHDKKKVFESLLKAQQESTLLEIAFGGSDNSERFGSRVLPFPGFEGVDRDGNKIIAGHGQKTDETADDAETQPRGFVQKEIPASFSIVPLEPTTGNIKIRKAPQVLIRYFIGLESYEIATTFQKVLMVDGSQAIQLAMPNQVRILPRRQQTRVAVPPQANMKVTVQKRGSTGFDAHLIDLSPGGLSCACQEPHGLLEIGDKVGVIIQGPLLQGTPVSTFGSVCRIARARDENNLQQASQQFGIQFKLVSVADAMTIDRMVRELSKKPKKSR